MRDGKLHKLPASAIEVLLSASAVAVNNLTYTCRFSGNLSFLAAPFTNGKKTNNLQESAEYYYYYYFTWLRCGSKNIPALFVSAPQRNPAVNMNKLCARFLRSPSAFTQYSSFVALGRNLSYRSDLSLDVLYPNSNAQLYTPPAPVRMPYV